MAAGQCCGTCVTLMQNDRTDGRVDVAQNTLRFSVLIGGGTKSRSSGSRFRAFILIMGSMRPRSIHLSWKSIFILYGILLGWGSYSETENATEEATLALKEIFLSPASFKK